jgi:threonine dehydratase
VSTKPADTTTAGIACRIPNPHAVKIICAGAARVITVSEQEISTAMRHYFTDIHNVVEGAAAAPLAGLLQERGEMVGKRVGLILSGGNVDSCVFRDVLAMDD